MSKISVIMGIYNCEKTLSDAIDCILKQTYTDWELIMCDDGSTDNTYDVAKAYQCNHGDKIILIKNDKNYGLNYTLNKCLALAKGEYIARMDGDDLCSPERFEKEINVLKNNPEFDIVSSDMEFFDENGVWGHTSVNEFPQNIDFAKKTQFCHAACLVRKSAFDKVNGYSVDKKLLRVEDYHLWIKMYEQGLKGINIKEPLYQMRDDRNAVARKKFRFRLNEAYVKAYAVKHLKLPFCTYIYCLIPIVIGLIPNTIYSFIHKKIR